MKTLMTAEHLDPKQMSANKCKHEIKRGCIVGRLLLQFSQ